ncbi:MAG: acyl-CoA dehydrogenase [Desulfamplus sp.]|nr:acyl-CoA dehydrogenase [Desulfamplus sp.]
MAQLIADKRDVEFVLHEQFNAASLTRFERYATCNKKTIDLIVSEARNLAIKEILPLQKISDEGCKFDSGKVTVPKAYHKVLASYLGGEWLGMTDDPEWGGQGLPKLVSMAANEYFYGACNSFMLFHLLSHGAARLVENFGTEEQKNIYLANMLSGKWSGTMLLTEPDAGSDVGALTTSARKNPDGTYSITGNKIFISGGEHDMVENIIHPVLARIEGAPSGTKGISLFLVPKFRVNSDGSLGEFNDVVCTGIEHKLGLHGNCTCSLTLGGGGNCIGTLLGQENKGMSAMFVMMNEARQMVGLQGFANASAAYLYALNYARQRIQTKHITASANSVSVPIIQHPDVRRQLMIMKAHVEGMRSLIYYGGLCQDIEKCGETEEERTEAEEMVEVLTPIIKGYITDKAFEMCSHGIQVYGGYGFIEEYPIAQLLRDSRIFMLYEGTNGIQSIDLVGRKMGMKKGKPFLAFIDEITKTVRRAKEMEATQELAKELGEYLDTYMETALTLSKNISSDKMLNAYTYTHPFLESTGDLSIAWMLLWRASIAAQKIGSGKKDEAFYKGQIDTARFFIRYVIPVAKGRLAAISNCDGAAIEMAEDGFGGK